MQHTRSSADVCYEGSPICERGSELEMAQVEGPQTQMRASITSQGWAALPKNSVKHVTTMGDQRRMVVVTSQGSFGALLWHPIWVGRTPGFHLSFVGAGF